MARSFDLEPIGREVGMTTEHHANPEMFNRLPDIISVPSDNLVTTRRPPFDEGTRLSKQMLDFSMHSV